MEILLKNGLGDRVSETNDGSIIELPFNLENVCSELDELLYVEQMKVLKLTAALEYVVRHKETPVSLALIILDECVTICEQALNG